MVGWLVGTRLATVAGTGRIREIKSLIHVAIAREAGPEGDKKKCRRRAKRDTREVKRRRRRRRGEEVKRRICLHCRVGGDPRTQRRIPRDMPGVQKSPRACEDGSRGTRWMLGRETACHGGFIWAARRCACIHVVWMSQCAMQAGKRAADARLCIRYYDTGEY